MLNQRGMQPSTFEGGLDDLEGFLVWAEEIKAYLSQSDPALYEVLEHTASSKQPIEEESMVKASQDIMKDKHKALQSVSSKVSKNKLSRLNRGRRPKSFYLLMKMILMQQMSEQSMTSNLNLSATNCR